MFDFWKMNIANNISRGGAILLWRAGSYGPQAKGKAKKEKAPKPETETAGEPRDEILASEPGTVAIHWLNSHQLRPSNHRGS